MRHLIRLYKKSRAKVGRNRWAEKNNLSNCFVYHLSKYLNPNHKQSALNGLESNVPLVICYLINDHLIHTRKQSKLKNSQPLNAL
jgi:hypothetical protein